MRELARSRILDTGLRAIFHTVLLLSVFLLVRGHNAPGGGFTGGLVAGAAFVLLYAAGGVARVRAVLRVRPEVILGTGVALAACTAIGGWIGGGQVLESGKVVLHLPLFGSVKLFSVLAFDVGVYLVVCGMVTLLLERLGTTDAEEGASWS